MKNLLLLFALAVLLFSCAKDELPNSYKLNGVWQGRDTSLTMVISNLDNQGFDIKYLYYQDEKGEYLNRTFFKEVQTFKILSLSNYTLLLEDTNSSKRIFLNRTN